MTRRKREGAAPLRLHQGRYSTPLYADVALRDHYHGENGDRPLGRTALVPWPVVIVAPARMFDHDQYAAGRTEAAQPAIDAARLPPVCRQQADFAQKRSIFPATPLLFKKRRPVPSATTSDRPTTIWRMPRISSATILPRSCESPNGAIQLITDDGGRCGTLHAYPCSTKIVVLAKSLGNDRFKFRNVRLLATCNFSRFNFLRRYQDDARARRLRSWGSTAFFPLA